jgi:selenocysteine lyase/cysteine desulfurase
MVTEDLVSPDYRRALGIPEDVAAVNAGSWGPICEAAYTAMRDFIDADVRLRLGNQRLYAQDVYDDLIEQARGVAAALVGCTPGEVALCESSTTALNIVLWGLELASGDEILSSRLENPAAVVPLRTVAERRGLELRWLEFGDASEAVAAFERTITPKTRVLLISDIDFALGMRVDLRTISALAHEHGVFVLVDGAQAVGTTHVDVHALGVDAYAFARHKFLCGPDGGGVLCLSDDAVQQVAATFCGVFSDAEHGMDAEARLFGSARRFEVSTRGITGLVGATAATTWIQGIGLDPIAASTAARRNQVRDRLEAIPRVRVLSPQSDEGALLTFAVAGLEPVDLLAELAQRNIYGRTIVVTDPHGVRLSIGFWTRDVDIDAIERAVGEIAAETAP